MRRINTLLLILLCFLLLDCRNEQSTKNGNLDKDAFTFIVSKIMPQFINEPYDICGTLYSELPDSLVRNSIKDVFSQKDIEHIVQQYTLSKGKSVDPFLDQEKFHKKTGHVYYDSDSLVYHFALSAPLFNISKDTCVIFSLAMPISFRKSSTRDGFYFLVGINSDTLKYLGTYKNEYTTFIPNDSWEHFHEYSFIPY